MQTRATRTRPAHPAVILGYYFSIRGAAGQALREVKLILVGRGEVGKSTMADALRGLPFVKDRKRTDGIAITPWDVALADGDAKVLLWDFGGQEIMHGTHQCFLTHRSLYVVMVDGRHDRGKQDAEYWLKLVRAFGGESQVMVVMNRQKAHPFDVDREYLAGKYGVGHEHFFRTDCETKKTIEPLREAILEEAARMLAKEERFPKNRWDVKTRLEAMKKKGEDYLSEDDYVAICKEHGVEDAEEQGKLLRRLADLGTVVSFPDDVKLAEFSVLNPEWATDGIYRVVTNEPLREEKHGQLRCASLRDLLPRDRWPKPKHLQYIIKLMKKFELCFPVDGHEEAVLVPELLPDKTPPLGDWKPEECVVFHYEYTVLPHGVLPRFITRTHQMSEGKQRWRTSVVLADDGAEARVAADYDRNTVSVWVRGPHADGRRALLKVVRHARIKELKPKELVALKGHPEVLESFTALVKDERRGKTTVAVTIGEERVDVPIADFLDCIAPPAERRKAADEDEKHGRIIRVERGGTYIEGDHLMNQDDHSIHARDIINSQVGQTLTNCTNMIRQQVPGKRKDLLEQMDREVNALIAKLPEEKHGDAAEDLAKMVKGATAEPPNRRWYSMSAEGLLEASKFVKDFAGNIVGTVGKLGKLLWPDFKLADKEEGRGKSGCPGWNASLRARWVMRATGRSAHGATRSTGDPARDSAGEGHAQRGGIEDFGIQHPLRAASGVALENRARRGLAHARAGVGAEGRLMRCDEDIRRAHERMLGRQRFGDEGIERRARDPSLVQRAHERGLVHDGAARGVDEMRALFHPTELRLADEPARLRRERGVQGDKVGFREKLIECGKMHAKFFRLRQRSRRRGIKCDHAHPECRRAFRDRLPDAPAADEAERLARNLGAPFRFPCSRPQRDVALMHAARDGEEQHQRVFGDRLVQQARRVGDHDAEPRRDLAVNRIAADAPSRKHLQPRGVR